MTETVDPTRAVIALNQSYLAAAAELCRQQPRMARILLHMSEEHVAAFAAITALDLTRMKRHSLRPGPAACLRPQGSAGAIGRRDLRADPGRRRSRAQRNPMTPDEILRSCRDPQIRVIKAQAFALRLLARGLRPKQVAIATGISQWKVNDLRRGLMPDDRLARPPMSVATILRRPWLRARRFAVRRCPSAHRRRRGGYRRSLEPVSRELRYLRASRRPASGRLAAARDRGCLHHLHGARKRPGLFGYLRSPWHAPSGRAWPRSRLGLPLLHPGSRRMVAALGCRCGHLRPHGPAITRPCGCRGL